MALHLNKLASPLPKNVVEIGSVALEKKTKIWKIYHDNEDKTTTMMTNNKQILVKKSYLSLGLKWAKNWIPSPKINSKINPHLLKIW